MNIEKFDFGVAWTFPYTCTAQRWAVCTHPIPIADFIIKMVEGKIMLIDGVPYQQCWGSCRPTYPIEKCNCREEREMPNDQG